MFLSTKIQKWDRLVKSKKQLKCENNLNEISSLLRRDYPPDIQHSFRYTRTFLAGDPCHHSPDQLLTAIIEKCSWLTLNRRHYIRTVPNPCSQKSHEQCWRHHAAQTKHYLYQVESWSFEHLLDLGESTR